jgi:hypothetical protein
MSRRRGALRLVSFAIISVVSIVSVPSRAQDEEVAPSSAGPEYRNATQEQQVELLRRLLGVSSSVPASAPVPAAEPDPVPGPAATVDVPGGAEAIEAEPAPEAKPQPKKAAPKPVKRAAPKPASPAKRVPAPLPAEAPSQDAPVQDAPVQEVAVPPAAPELARVDYRGGLATLSETDLPPVGTVIDGSNIERWSHVMIPAMQWASRHGVKSEVVEPKVVVMEPWRVAATERYHAQVALAPDRKSLRNYVAGLPFPSLAADDPDLAVKIMFNFENRISFDDLDAPDFACLTGALDKREGLTARRNGRFGHLRRLYYTGRMVVDPKPTWPSNNEGIRYRESLFPVIEPFNNKGAGFSYIRHLDSARQDDAWLYFPLTRRVRRLSTAQRSEGIFGTDLDLDSYGGFAGNPAWFDWTLLGKKTLLAPFHPRHQPIKWCEKPGEFMFCDVWEPREFWVIAARSLIPGYNFSLRILYVDVQSNAIPFTEVYDHEGQLWRGYVQQLKAGLRKAVPSAVTSYDHDMAFLGGVTVFDMQLQTTSRCEFPSQDASDREGWYYFTGDKGGTRPEDFEVASFIKAGR